MADLNKLRSYRPIANVALFDVVATYLLTIVFLTMYYRRKGLTPDEMRLMNVPAKALYMFPIGICVHAMLNIPTEVNSRIGLSDNPASATNSGERAPLSSTTSNVRKPSALTEGRVRGMSRGLPNQRQPDTYSDGDDGYSDFY